MTTPLPRRRWWPHSLAGKAAVFALFSVILLVAIWFVALATTQRRLDQAIEKAKSLGCMETWDETAGPTIPDAENAAVALLAAGRMASAEEEKIVAAYEASERKLDIQALLAVASGRLIANEDYERFVAAADSLPKYRTTMKLEDSHANGKIENSAVAHFTSLMLMEAAQAKALSDRGRPEDAVHRALRWLRITRKFAASEPWTLASFSAVGARHEFANTLNRLLRAETLPPALYSEIEREAAAHDRSIAMWIRGVNGVRLEAMKGLEGSSPYHRYALLQPVANIDSTFIYESISTFLETVDEPHAVAISRFDRVHPLMGLPTVPRQNLLALNVGGSLQSLRRVFDRSTALMRCLRIVNAMAATKDFNAELDSLGLPSDCLIDPFDGERLRIKRTPDGPIVYSVGCDLTDEDGKLDDSRKPYDIGLGPVPPGKK